MLKTLSGRILLVLMGTTLALALLEGGMQLGIRVSRGEWFSPVAALSTMRAQAKEARRQPATAGPGEYSVGAHEVIHPYIGFVPDPAASPEQSTIGDPQQIPPRSDQHLTVGVFGGSFAAGVCHWADAELRRVLARTGKPVRLVCLAAGGYKQPQQLLALTYLLAQGTHFDLVLNIDGFNEVALPPDNLRQSVAPIYPRSWFWRVGNIPDASALKLLGALSTVEADRRQWAARCVRWRCDRSALLTSLWERADRRWDARRSEMLAAIQDFKTEQRASYAATGPAVDFADDPALYDYLGRIWKDSSAQMHALCSANGIAYAHFLQPNQYVVGSKPMEREERRVTGAQGPYRKAGTIGYPILRARGEELRRAGVDFHDLTMLFADVTEPLYSDGCCHLQPIGYVRIAQAIGERLRSP